MVDAADRAAGGHDDALAAADDIHREEPGRLDALPGTQDQQRVLRDRADAVVDAIGCRDAARVGGIGDRQRSALVEREMAGVVVSVMGERMPGAQRGQRIVRPPALSRDEQAHRAPAEDLGARQHVLQPRETAGLDAGQRLHRRVVEQAEPPAVAAVIALAAVDPLQVARVGGEDGDASARSQTFPSSPESAGACRLKAPSCFSALSPASALPAVTRQAVLRSRLWPPQAGSDS